MEEAKVNGQLSASVFIDQGSSVRIMTATLAIRAGAPNRAPTENDTFYGLGQKSTESLEKTVVEVEIEDIKAKVEVYVVPDGVIAHDMLIGRSFLDLENVIMIKARDHVRLFYSNKDGPFKNFTLENSETKYAVRSSKAVEVQPNSVQLIDVHTYSDRQPSFMMLTTKEDNRSLLLESCERLTAMTDELKEAGIIRDSTSPYASPCLLVRKKNGEYRKVVDYRRQADERQVPSPHHR